MMRWGFAAAVLIAGCDVERDWLLGGVSIDVPLEEGQRRVDVLITLAVDPAAVPEPERVVHEVLTIRFEGPERHEVEFTIDGEAPTDEQLGRVRGSFTSVHGVIEGCVPLQPCAREVVASIVRGERQAQEAWMYASFHVMTNEPLVRGPDDTQLQMVLEVLPVPETAR